MIRAIAGFIRDLFYPVAPIVSAFAEELAKGDHVDGIYHIKMRRVQFSISPAAQIIVLGTSIQSVHLLCGNGYLSLVHKTLGPIPINEREKRLLSQAIVSYSRNKSDCGPLEISVVDEA